MNPMMAMAHHPYIIHPRGPANLSFTLPADASPLPYRYEPSPNHAAVTINIIIIIR